MIPLLDDAEPKEEKDKKKKSKRKGTKQKEENAEPAQIDQKDEHAQQVMTEEEYNKLLCKKIDVSYLETVDHQERVVNDIFNTIIV